MIKRVHQPSRFCIALLDVPQRYYNQASLLQYIARPERRVWPAPGKDPRENVDRAIVVTVHHESTVRTAIRTFPERHGLQITAAATGFRRVAFILYNQFFPVQLAFVGEHLGERVQAPIVKHSSIEGFLALLVLPHDHLPLTQITDHDSSLNQFVSDEMRGFVQAITLLVALLLSNALVDLAQMEISTRLFLAFVAFGTDFV